MIIKYFFFLATVFLFAAEASTVIPNFIETGECENEEMCSYLYSAEQENFGSNNENQMLKVTATVDVTCTSSGLYNNSDAKLFCMDIKEASLNSNMLENATEDDLSVLKKSFNKQVGNWFCFIQASSGKILAVYHSLSEPDHIISLKKTITAAFQTNFRGTSEEEEIDPQSHHTSHYSYIPTDEEGLLHVKRTIRKNDVNQYSTDVVQDDVDTSKDEEVVYQSGKLKRSSGKTSFQLVNTTESSDKEPIALSNAFSASGSYIMSLNTCNRLSQNSYLLYKRKLYSQMKQGMREENLQASVNKELEAVEQMKMMREKLPSGSALKALNNYHMYGDKLVQVLLVLIELESKYGPLPSYNPVLDEIIAFVQKMPHSRHKRDSLEGVVMLLVAEGSLKSQIALLQIYDAALDGEEANMILTHISFMETVHIDFAIGIEKRLNQTSNYQMLTNQMILVYGSLANKGSVEVEIRVITYLSRWLTVLTSEIEPDSTQMKVLLYALGNTGSKLSITVIWSFLNSSAEHDYYTVVMPSAIEALSKVTDDPTVLTIFEEQLVHDPSIECIATILETLEDAFEHIAKAKKDIQQYIQHVRAHTLIRSLAEAVSVTNDTNIHIMMDNYLIKIKADESIVVLIHTEYGPLERSKRGTIDWDSASNSDYNHVQGLADRQLDVNTYNRHQAYINSKTIGISKANIKIAYGYFAGTNTHCSKYKAYGRAKVIGSLLSKTTDLADVKLDMRLAYDTTSASVVAYAKIGRNTLLNYNVNTRGSNCRQYTRNLAEVRVRILRLEYSIFIYVTSISLTLDLYVHFNMGTNLNFCLGRSGTEVSGALASLTPTAGMTVTGGVHANLLSAVRGGIEVSVTLNYRLEPAASVQGCTAYCSFTRRMCIGIYDSNSGSNVRLQAYYQTRRIKLCRRGWFRYPCIRWGSRRTWSKLTRNWSIGRQDRRTVWQQCSGYLHPTCAAGVLSSPLFSG